MVFTPKLMSAMPGGEPDVTIVFHGQLLLRSETGTTCEVGTNPVAANHVLSVEVRTKRPGKCDLINLRLNGPLNFRQPEGLKIEVKPAVFAPAAYKCITLDPINHDTGEGPPNGPPDEDFRWLLNLEGDLFHRRDLQPTIFETPQRPGTQHVIRLQGGEYFFQTGQKADMSLDFQRTGGGLGDRTFKGIGAVATAKVFLANASQSVVLTWNDGSRERVLTLTKTAGITYEIYIENTPRFVQVEDFDELSSFEELTHFYQVIPEVLGDDQFRLTPDRPEQESESGSPTIPCQVMLLDGPAN